MKSKIIAIIQARMGATRLPNKTMMEIEGKPMLWHIVRRVKHAKTVNGIVIATTENENDDAIENLAADCMVGIFRGSENDVLDRFYRAAQKSGATAIVRITADDPFKDPEVIDKAVKAFIENKADYASNTIEPTYPEGIDVEVFSFAALERAWKEAKRPSEREHVTPYIWNNPSKFRLLSIRNELGDLSKMRWTVDDQNDMRFAREVYRSLYRKKPAFLMSDILKLLKERPDIPKINEGHARYEGYARQLEAESMQGIMERVGRKEREYVEEVLKTNFRSSSGSIMMKRLEQAFAEKFGVKFAISHINGTATLHSALAAAGIGLGDEVMVPPLTMSSTSFAVLQENAVPVFADVDPDTFLISPESIRERITERTKAIIPVALYGLAPDMDEIMAIARKHNLVVIEDSAQCFLGRYKGRLVGTIGHLGSYSFQSSKHMTSGEGGMVITNDQSLADRVRRFSSLGYAAVGASKPKISKDEIQDPSYERHECMGWNYRMPEMCAAVALGQLENLDALVNRRREVAAMFREAIEGCGWLVAQKVPPECEHSYWTFAAKIDAKSVKWHDFRKKFLEMGGDRFYGAWQLTYLEPAFRNMRFFGREKIFKSGLYSGRLQSYGRGLCPVAEDIQPRLMQFKTNYWDIEKAKSQARMLEKTTVFFGKRTA